VKHLIVFLFLYGIGFRTYAQASGYMHAVYSITKTHIIPAHGTTPAKPLVLNYTGHFYSKGQKAVSFIKPLYLAQYPSGQIPSTDPSVLHTFTVCTDTLQDVHLIDYDSLTWKTKNDLASGAKGSHYYFTFEPGFRQWTILPETKTINGLSTQRAILKAADGSVVYDVWFCADVETIGGEFGMFYLPGLLIEGTCPILGATYRLENYALDVVVDSAVFRPFENNASFTKRNHLKKMQ
jgi:GLPGLI family protein